MVSKTILKNLFSRIQVGGFKVTWWDGQTNEFGPDKPEFTLHFKDPAVVKRLAKNLSLGFGESYMEGLIDIDGDLHDVVELANRNKAAFPDLSKGSLGRLMRGVGIGASIRQAKQDIHEHYDLGNDFYKLWLDQSMSYSCAYYKKRTDTLEQAQAAKLDHVAKKLLLKPGLTVIDIGSGWGALSIHLAQKYKVKVKGFNISKEQIYFSREQIKKKGLTKQIEIIDDDYRNSNLQCDRLVSVGFFEHVGRPNHDDYFKTIQRQLKPGGVSLLHTITTDKERATDPWISKYIFPGGYIPSWREVVSNLPNYDMFLTDVESLRIHYAMTLDEWAIRFEKHVDEICKKKGEQFIRMWRLYLRASAASFRTSGLDLHQFVFTHGLNNNLPLTRDYLS